MRCFRFKKGIWYDRPYFLLPKLKVYGIRGVTHDWFRSYLTNTQQGNKIGEALSERKLVKTGVPQGSIIGPVLFLLCINDLEIVCQNTQSNFFDDDANLRTSISKENTLDNLLNKDLYRIQDWLSDNHSSLHIDKSILLRYRGKSNSKWEFNLR